MCLQECTYRLSELYEEHRVVLSELTEINGKVGDYMHPVFGEGDKHSRLMLIGEAPGGEEAAAGRPFVGRAGQTLDTLLAQTGIERSGIFLTNTVKYRPLNIKKTRSGKDSYSNRTPCTKEIEFSLPLLKAELDIIKPDVVVTLGNVPLKAIWAAVYPGEKGPTIGDAHGDVYDMNGNFKLCPLYHPASGIYRRELIAVMEADIQKLRELISA